MYIGFILNGRNNLEYCRMLSSDANDLDRRFGEFCFSQVRKQLKGAYLPEERIYCIEAADGDKNRVESLVRDIIDRGAWPSDDYQRLRDIGFVHETADSYRRTDSRDFIVGELERTLHNGRACCSSMTQAGDWSGRRAISSIMRTTSSARYTGIPTNWASIISARTTQGWWKRRGSVAVCSPLMTGAVSSPPGRNSSGRTSCGDASLPWSATCPPTSPDTGRC